MNILLAEDDPTCSTLLELNLREWGHNVTVAADGLQAKRAFEADPSLRIAVLDWMMPEIDGIELCRSIRNLQNRPYVYLIMLTAKSAREDMMQGFEAGADDFIVKPFDIPTLRLRLRAAERILAYEQTMEETQQRMSRSQHLAAIGIMAAGIAHEINQPLNALTITVEGLEYQLQNNREIARDVLLAKLRRLSEQCRRIEKIIIHTRALAKPNPVAAVESVDIQNVLDAVMPLLGNQLANRHIALFVDLPPNARAVKASPIQLEQVFANLIANAINAFNLTDKQNMEIRIASKLEGDRVRLTIADNAIGIGNHGDRIFEPFFSASSGNSAIGLGLSIVSKFVYSWDADIQAQNNDRGGATFSIILRRA